MTNNRWFIPSAQPDDVAVLHVALADGVTLEITVAVGGPDDPIVVLLPTVRDRSRYPGPYRHAEDHAPEWTLLN